MIAPYINAIYSIFVYGLVRATGRFLIPPLPPAVSIELSTHCNLSCPECVTGSGTLTRRKGFMDPSLALKLASELSGNVLSAYLYFQGEPMMHPRFFGIARMFRKMNPVISSNGHFLDSKNCNMLARSGLKKIIISYDGVNPDTYNIYRVGGDHARVKEGIERLTGEIERFRSPLVLELQFLEGRHNFKEISEAKRFAESVNARFRIKSMQVLDPDRAERWVPDESRRARYIRKEGRISPVRTRERGCLRMWTTAVVTIDGDVLPCCYDKNGVHMMGNIKEHTFRDIWNSEEYTAFRKAVLKKRSSVDICRECPQGMPLRFRG